MANGKVYVAAYKQLTIFGILPATALKAALQLSQTIEPQPSQIASPDSPHVITGTLLAIDRSTLTIKTRTGKSVKIDLMLKQFSTISQSLILGTPIQLRDHRSQLWRASRREPIFRAQTNQADL